MWNDSPRHIPLQQKFTVRAPPNMLAGQHSRTRLRARDVKWSLLRNRRYGPGKQLRAFAELYVLQLVQMCFSGEYSRHNMRKGRGLQRRRGKLTLLV